MARVVKRSLAGVTIALMALLAWAVVQTFRSYTWSQTVTGEIVVNGTRYTGSAVSRITWKKRWAVDPAGGFIGRRYQNSVASEAAVIEVPGRTPVFLLLQSVSVDTQRRARRVTENNRPYVVEDLASGTCLPKLTGYHVRLEVEEISGIVGCKGSVTAIPDTLRPILAVFDNINDPRTLRAITSDAELSDALGAPSHIGAMTLTIDDAPATTGRLRTYLPWLPETTIDSDGKNAELTTVKTAFASARGEVSRQIAPSHFRLRACYGVAAPCGAR